jgi:hypothetical protein
MAETIRMRNKAADLGFNGHGREEEDAWTDAG